MEHLENQEAIEPIEYFNNLKENLSEVVQQEIITVQNNILKEIARAKELNQIVLANDLLFTYKVTQKELIASANGFNRYVSRSLIQKFVDKIEPINSVKVIDLEHYPRIIPTENAEIIRKAQELNIFDEFAVIFTDLEDNVKHTEADKEFIERNKDPIVLGYFYNKEYRQRYDRYYVITDWVDEYCDLTFEKMVREISSLEIPHKEEELGEINLEEIEEYIDKTMTEIYGRPMGKVREKVEKERETKIVDIKTQLQNKIKKDDAVTVQTVSTKKSFLQKLKWW